MKDADVKLMQTCSASQWEESSEASPASPFDNVRDQMPFSMSLVQIRNP
jgi:hypothetical protein